MGSILKETRKGGTSVFRAEVRREGQRITKRFSRRTDAKDWIALIETAIVRGEPVEKLKRYTLADAIDKYIQEILPLKKASTRKLHKTQLQVFKDKIGNTKLNKLTASELSTVREELRREVIKVAPNSTPVNRSASTLNRYFQPLMHCLSIAKDQWGWLHELPRLKKFKENPARTEFYSPAEIRAVLAQIEREGSDHLSVEKRIDRQFSKQMNLLIARIALHTGARLTETCKLRWANVDLVEGVINFVGEDTKTGHGRHVPISAGLLTGLIEWKKDRAEWSARFPTDYLFPAMRPSKRGYRSDFASKVFCRTAKKLGIVGKTFHDIRHTTATWATKQLTPTRTVMSLLGHQKIGTTERYAHVEVAAQREAVEAIEALLIGQEEKEEKKGDMH